MQFECSEEEIVRIVRRREGYSLWKSYWKSPLSRGILCLLILTLVAAMILSMLDISRWSAVPAGIAVILVLIFNKRLHRTCRGDAMKVLLDYAKDYVASGVKDDESLGKKK